MFDEIANVITGGNHSDKLLNEAQELISIGEYQDAQQLLDKCIKIEPNWGAPLRYRAWIFAIHNYELDTALAAINKNLKILSSRKNISQNIYAHTYDIQGEIYLRKNDVKNAITSFVNCLKVQTKEMIDPDFSTFYRLGICYFIEKDYKNAHYYFSKAISLDTKNPQVYSFMGDTCLAISSYNIAIENYDKAIDLSKEWDFNYPLKGYQVNTEGKQQFIYSCFVNKGCAYQYLGDNDNCLKCNEEAIKYFKEDPTALINIAEMYAIKTDKVNIRKYLEKGIPLIDPDKNKNLMNSLLNFNFNEYKDIVLELLFKLGKISKDDYDLHIHHLKTQSDNPKSGTKPEDKAINIITNSNIGGITMGNESKRIIKTEVYQEVGNNTGIMNGIMNGQIVNFSAAQNADEFTKELQKLKEHITKLQNDKTIDSDIANQINTHVNEAINQTAVAKPDKKSIIDNLEKAKNTAESFSRFVDAVKPIVKMLISAGTVAIKFFGH